MLELKVASRHIQKKIRYAFLLKLLSLFIVQFFLISNVEAQQRTVGDLLKKIEKDAERTRVQKARSALPKFQSQTRAASAPVNLREVKPPPSTRSYYPAGTNEAELMKTTDAAISQLFKLSQRYKKSSKRGELWLRLAEQYVEKAKLIEYQIQTQFDKDMQAFLAKKTKRRPKLDLKASQAYNKKAIQLYEWFIRDFPKDPKVDQAYYFLGFNNFELGNVKKGEQYYVRLTKEFPRSPYIIESNYALAEFYFENEKWKDALGYYGKVVKVKQNRLQSLAMYKAAWCYYKLNDTRKGIKLLEQVILDGRRSRAQDASSRDGKIKLATEAVKDLVLFYAEAGRPESAFGYFAEIVGPKSAGPQVAKLAGYYLDTGNLAGARTVIQDIIQADPNDPKNFEYQSRLVTAYQTSKDQENFRKELYEWVQVYGPRGAWQQANIANPKLIAGAQEKMEFTLRNYVLQQHQGAQNARTESAQKRALQGYALYFDTFSTGPKLDEMHFFFGELLFDMGAYEKAAVQYNWVIENTPKSTYAEKATLNTLLALEKRLPTPEQIKKIVGTGTEPIPFTPEIEMFEKAAARYFQQNPNGDNVPAIKYRVGSLHYYFNHYKEALFYFNDIIEKYPKTQFAQFSANLMLDIYNLKKDYVGLQAAAERILKVPELAKSDVGKQVGNIKVQTDFKLAKDLEDRQKFLEAAEHYKSFAIANKSNPLAITAVYNAGINFERIGKITEAIPMYEAVAGSKAATDKSLAFNSAKFLPPLYEKTGQYERAANAFEDFAKKNPKDDLAVEYHYNAALIFDAMNKNTNAIRNYNIYFERKNGAEKFEALFLLGKLYERLKNYPQANSYYDKYMNSGTVNAAGVVEAAFSIAKIHALRGKKKFADEWYERTVVTQKALARQGKVVGVSFAAEAKLNLVSETYRELIRIKIPAAGKAQAAAVEKKLGLLNRLKEQLKGVITYDDGFQIVAALNMQGQALAHMYDAIMSAPPPKGLNADEAKQYKEGVSNIANPFKDQAVETLSLAIKRGHELQAYNDSLVEAIDRLNQLQGEKKKDFDARVKIAASLDRMGAKWKSNVESAVVQEAAEALAKDSKDLKILNGLGIYYLENKKPGLAKILFNRALDAHPDAPAVHNNLGVMYLQQGEVRKGLESLRRSLTDKRYRMGALNLSSIYLKHKDYQRAVGPLDDAYDDVKSDLRRGDEFAVAIANNYAVSLMGTDSNSGAKKIFEAILGSGSRDAEVHLNYAILLVDLMDKKIDGQKILSKIQFMTEDRNILKRAAELEKNVN